MLGATPVTSRHFGFPPALIRLLTSLALGALLVLACSDDPVAPRRVNNDLDAVSPQEVGWSSEELQAVDELAGQLLQSRSAIHHETAAKTEAMGAARPERGSHDPGTFFYYNVGHREGIMGKSILILKGSPRERGNSSTLADQVAAGARASGAQVESVWLHGLEIQPCSACEGCGGPGGPCVVEDDMQSLYPKLAAADAIVLASPVYWFSMSAQLKRCIDRWYAFQATSWQALKGKRFAIVLAYGDTDLNTSGGINAIQTFESMCRFLRGEIIGIVHGSLANVGDAEKKPTLMRDAFKLGERLAAE